MYQDGKKENNSAIIVSVRQENVIISMYFHFKTSATFFFPETFYKVGGDNCSCQAPCETISYKPSLSYGGFPSKSVALDEGKRVWTPNTTTYKSAAEFGDALHENMR